MSEDAQERAPIKMQVRDLYKIFGPEAESMVALVRDGMTKSELLTRHRHVLGLQNIQVDMRQGQITVIMGLSGSGKSTLIRHLNRLIEPTAGQVLLDGQDITTLAPDALRDLRRSRMSMVFQKFALLPHRTILQNVALAPTIRGEPADVSAANAKRWLTRVGLAGYESHYPHQLSGGMQQRVGIARALCSEAEVMLMDEAFSALDPIIRTDMQGLLLELQRELYKTIIFITHDLDEALRLADHLVVLNDGRVIQQGDPQDIVMKPAEAYIESFVRDINRARVLRVRSIMHPLTPGNASLESLDASQSLEQAIAMSNGDVEKIYRVTDDGRDVGMLTMRVLLAALAPKSASKAARHWA